MELKQGEGVSLWLTAEVRRNDTSPSQAWTVVEVKPDTPADARLFADDVWARAQGRFPVPHRLTLEERRVIAAELDEEFQRYTRKVRAEAIQVSAYCTPGRDSMITGEPYGLG